MDKSISKHKTTGNVEPEQIYERYRRLKGAEIRNWKLTKKSFSNELAIVKLQLAIQMANIKFRENISEMEEKLEGLRQIPSNIAAVI